MVDINVDISRYIELYLYNGLIKCYKPSCNTWMIWGTTLLNGGTPWYPKSSSCHLPNMTWFRHPTRWLLGDRPGSKESHAADHIVHLMLLVYPPIPISNHCFRGDRARFRSEVRQLRSMCQRFSKRLPSGAHALSTDCCRRAWLGIHNPGPRHS
jgi:hypothetical protein